MSGFDTEEIIRMAREAFGAEHELFWMNGTDENLERFASLVAAAEREECAKRLDAIGCDHCAENIRLRGNDAA